MRDRFGRTIDYMRISITDRCNFRCRYCMPVGIRQVPMDRILTYEQIEEICGAAVDCGITKFKITGGEPLVRLGCPDLIRKIHEIPGVEQITMTTNGMLLSEYLPALTEAGLSAVNVSLDTLDRDRFREITSVDGLDRVRKGIDDAVRAGLRVKINTVLQYGINDKEWPELIRLAEKQPVDVRFIEMMPIGHGKRFEEISNEFLQGEIRKLYPEIAEDSSIHGNGPAQYLKIPGFQGSIGFISAIHGKFCSSCNRIRLTSQGQLKPCLCYADTVDVKEAFLQEDPEVRRQLLREKLRTAMLWKPEGHCFTNYASITELREMVQIGG